MKVRPSQASTPAFISGSWASLATPSIKATRTPTLMAFTGGLLIQMMPMSPRFSKLPCMKFSAKKSDPSDAPPAVDHVHFAGGLGGEGAQIVNRLGHLLWSDQGAERR